MEKENSSHNNDINLTKKKKEEEVLEISSTGYGLESVTEETEENSTDLKMHTGNPSCGGL